LPISAPGYNQPDGSTVKDERTGNGWNITSFRASKDTNTLLTSGTVLPRKLAWPG
jgi:hypothetical protein